MEQASENNLAPPKKSRAEYMRNYYATHPEFRKKKYENQKEYKKEYQRKRNAEIKMKLIELERLKGEMQIMPT